jgi:hypothetical protein
MGGDASVARIKEHRTEVFALDLQPIDGATIDDCILRIFFFV